MANLFRLNRFRMNTARPFVDTLLVTSKIVLFKNPVFFQKTTGFSKTRFFQIHGFFKNPVHFQKTTIFKNPVHFQKTTIFKNPVHFQILRYKIPRFSKLPCFLNSRFLKIPCFFKTSVFLKFHSKVRLFLSNPGVFIKSPFFNKITQHLTQPTGFSYLLAYI